ncbi:hypothetical protein T11_7378 [Trichinella zimbabwensis]|uniref:Uncharacterized protein n=1 Tax=Trichinella zimbabwensis TaxID=268475 RepID=A0A0V1G9D6_9BILA|nr:hypothetical protein T11_7378 [Trichinella zimbabwensis]
MAKNSLKRTILARNSKNDRFWPEIVKTNEFGLN